MKIFWASRFRGVYKHLFESTHIKHTFLYQKSRSFETETWIRKILVHIWKSRLFDYLGIIQSIKCHKNCDVYGSMNRFLNVNKPYFISIENPTAVYHYCLDRKNTFLGKNRLNKLINDPHLKALVFWSNACASTFEQVCTSIPKGCISQVIYPLIPANRYVSKKLIEQKSKLDTLKLLYIAQGMRFTSKGALETIESFRNLSNKGYDISLTIITSIHEISPKLIQYINNIKGITLYDFHFSYTELEKIYAKNNILIQPTSDDSFGFTILEAMKGGNAILASTLYAIPELVNENINGFLTQPHYWYFDKNNHPSPEIWNNTKRTIYSNRKCSKTTSFLEDKISLLYHNRNLLEEMSINSWQIANSSPFDEHTISNQWNNLLDKISSN